MNTFPTAITKQKANITQVKFLDITDSEIEALNVETIDLTYNNLGKVTAWFEVDTSDTSKKILNIGSDGTTCLTTGKSLFSGWSSLITLETGNMDVLNVTDMSYMFMSCAKLTILNLNNWDVSNVTDISYIFAQCGNLANVYLNNWDTSSVENMGAIFYECNSLTLLDVSTWDVSNVTDMSSMFVNCKKLTTLDLSNWKVVNVNYITYMFYGCTSLTTIYANANWEMVATKLTNSSYVFSNCTKLVGAVSYSSSNTGISMANPDTGYFTRKTS